MALRLRFLERRQNQVRETVKSTPVANGPWIISSRRLQSCVAPNFRDFRNILRSELVGPGFDFLSFLGREGLR